MSPEKTRVARALEERGGRRERWAGTLVGWTIKLYCLFLRFEVRDEAGVGGSTSATGALYAMWHNRLLVVPAVWRRLVGDRKSAVLTSASKDGALLAAVMKVFAIESVRGSSSRRSSAALVGLMRKLKEGYHLGVTPDGPRGPRYVLQPGLIKLAQACQVPLVPIRVEYARAWRINSWDRFQIPKPFSRVRVTFGRALDIPRRLDEDEFEARRKEFETVMRAGVDDLIPDDHDQN